MINSIDSIIHSGFALSLLKLLILSFGKKKFVFYFRSENCGHFRFIEDTSRVAKKSFQIESFNESLVVVFLGKQC